MSNLPANKLNLISFHYQIYFPDFTQAHLRQIVYLPSSLNFGSLVKTLFTPYRRIASTGKDEKFGAKTLADKLTLNIISVFIGFIMRIFLLIFGVITMFFLLFANLILIAVYLVLPLMSWPAFTAYCQNNLFEEDLRDASRFSQKLSKQKLFNLIALFFDQQFLQSFNQLPSPDTLGITSGQNAEEIFLILLKKWQPLKQYFESQNIKEKHIEVLLTYLSHIIHPLVLKPKSTFGQMLTYGYTNTLDKFAREVISNRLPSKEKLSFLNEIQKVLARASNNNVLLIGEPGVGRHNTLEELSAAIKSNLLPQLAARRIMLLDTVSLASTGKNLIETKKSFEAVLSEAKSAGNIILVIDNVDKIATSSEGRIDLTDVLTSVLNDNSLPIIGITTPDDFAKYIRTNSSFFNLFEKLDLAEASSDETISVLIGKALEAAEKQKVQVLFSSLLEITEKSGRLVMDRKQPEKSILLLDDAVAEALVAAKIASTKAVVNIELVDKIISQKTKTPLGKITEKESEKLRDLESLLHARIVGQDEAVVEISKAMRRSRAEIETGTRPIGSFLFLGPTGVGKTETAKALAEAYFGADNRMVRLDMSEFQGQDAIKRLIGDINEKSPGQLATLIRENPYGLLLVDEFEKATKDVHNLFLQILDEGLLTDAFGKKVSFDNVIIIATSNAGAEFIREQLSPTGSNPVSKTSEQGWTLNRQGSSLGSKFTPREIEGQGGTLSKQLIDFILSQGLFSPELINRFDAVVVYKPLSQDQIIKVTTLMLEDLANKLKETKNITLEISQELASAIAKAGFDPEFGARPIRRLIQDKIEDGIAKMIIDGTAKSGSKIDAKTLLGFL